MTTRSFKPEVRTGVDPKFYGNNLAFATREEAEASARDLAARWMIVVEHRAVESDQPVNYKLADGVLTAAQTTAPTPVALLPHDAPLSPALIPFSGVPLKGEFYSPEGSLCRKVTPKSAKMMDPEDSCYVIGDTVTFGENEMVEFTEVGEDDPDEWEGS